MQFNLNNVAFDSRYRYEYIFSKSHANFTTVGGTAIVTVAHNLGYVPFFRFYFSFSGDTNFYLGFEGPNALLGNWRVEILNADTANLNLTMNWLGSGQSSGTFYYRIYQEPQS